MFAVFPNTGFFPCLDPRYHRFVNRMSILAASLRLYRVAVRDQFGVGELAKLAKLALLHFCTRYCKDSVSEEEVLARVFERLPQN